MKGKLAIILLLVGVLLLAGTASALPITIKSVEIDNTDLSASGSTRIRALDRGDEVEVKVEIEVDGNITEELEDVQIEAVIRGYDHDNLIEDISDAFDAKPGRTYVERLKLKLDVRMDQDEYRLRIRIEDRNGDTTQETYDLQIEAENHALWIKDVVFSPENVVQAGRALLSTVRVENIGMQDEDEGLKIVVSIPELGVSASDYIDELEEDESTTSEELYLRIPRDADPGNYRVLVTAIFNDGDDSVTQETSITVTEAEDLMGSRPGPETDTTPKTVISVGSLQQNVAKGKGGVIYPITITNAGADSKTYTLTVEGADEFATVRVDPSNVAVVSAGDTKTSYVYVTAKDTATAGEHLFAVTVSSAGKTLKQIALKANVLGSAGTPSADGGWDSLKKGLEIGLVILVVLLVIIGLIIGFNKLKGEEDEEEPGDSSQTYY